MSTTLLAFTVALAAPPLVVAADEAEPGLRAWWRVGELIVAPAEGDPRPGVRPLEGTAPTALPPDLHRWIPLLGDCPDVSSTMARPFAEASATVELAATDRAVTLRVMRGNRVLAAGSLGRPATPCSLHVGQADALPGYEVLLGWRAPAGVRGLTVFRVPPMSIDPAALDPTGGAGGP